MSEKRIIHAVPAEVQKREEASTGDYWRKEVVSTNKSHKLIANKQRYIVCVWFKVEHLASIIINSCSFTASTYNKDVINWKKMSIQHVLYLLPIL